MAAWLESYAVNQDLVVWMKSQPVCPPTYDPEKKLWTVTVDHDGEEVVLHPAHIVVATGFLAGPRTPELPGRDLFGGVTIHSVQFKGPKEFEGKDVVVVGAGNTGIDVCQDLTVGGAKSVTMIQRSSTCVVSRANVGKELAEAWPPGVPVEVGDFKFASVPLGFIKKMMISHQSETWAAEQELHAKLKKGGLNLNIGPDGQGQFLLVFERGGGRPIVELCVGRG